MKHIKTGWINRFGALKAFVRCGPCQDKTTAYSCQYDTD